VIGVLKDLLIERTAAVQGAPTLVTEVPDPRVLVVDATSGRATYDIAQRLEAHAVVVSYAKVEYSANPRLIDARPDALWLFVDAGSDATYCGLVAQELRARFAPARLRVFAFGDYDDALPVDLSFGPIPDGRFKRRREQIEDIVVLMQLAVSADWEQR
jgi:hypothetical protein